VATEKINSPSRELDWRAVFGIAIVHVLATLAVFPQFFSLSGMIIGIVLFFLTGWIGIALGYHRLLTHSSFKTHEWLGFVIATLGTMAWQGGPIKWVGDHRLHHQYSDTEDDPHSPKHGFSWSHVWWTLWKKHRVINHDPYRVTRDLQRKPGIVLIDRFFWVPQVCLTVALFSIGYILGDFWMATSWVAWGVGLRTVVVYHTTWFVNSAAHTWGYKNPQANDDSRNNWWVAILSGGEGWHSNHHADQRSARHGQRWWEVDLVWITIKFLEFFGVVWDVQSPKK